jgi:hypothetical protein
VLVERYGAAQIRTNDIDLPQSRAFCVGSGRNEQRAVVDFSFVAVHVLGVKLNTRQQY